MKSFAILSYKEQISKLDVY